MTTRHTIYSSKLPEALDNTSFVLLADLHNCTFGKNNQRLIKKIEALKPDFIIIAGDMVNRRESCYPNNAYTLLEQLAKGYKLYYAYGNHEYRLEQLGKDASAILTEEDKKYSSTWVDFKRKLSDARITLLHNESAALSLHSVNLQITGLSLPDELFEVNPDKELPKEEIDALIGESSKEDFQLLIAHNPEHFHAYASWGADLTVSGHLHGGIMRIPGLGGVISPQAKLFPKYDSGKHTEGDRHIIISRGLGSHSIMPRIFNIPELIKVELVRNTAS